MKRRRKLWILTTCVALLLLVLSQCTGTPAKRATSVNDNSSRSGKTGAVPEGGAAMNGRTLHIGVSLSPAAFTSLRTLSGEFAQSHGGMSISLENVADKDAYDTWKKASQLGEAPDLMLLDNNWVNEFAALGYLQPVDDLFTTEMQAQRIPIVLDQVKWNGYLWGVPHDVDPYLLVWNKKAAAAAGLDHAPESAGELQKWNQLLSKPAEGQYGLYFIPYSSASFIALSSALSGVWLDPAQTAAKWKEPSTVQALKSFLLPFASNAKSASPPAPAADWDPWDQLQKGKLAAMITTFSAFREHEAPELAIASLPATYTDDKGNSVWLAGHSFVLSSHSANQTAAMEWIKEMSTQDAAARLWTDAKQLPALIPVLNSAAIRSDPYAKSYEWLLDHALALPTRPDTDKKLLATQSELQKLLKGDEEASAFADRMAATWTP